MALGLPSRVAEIAELAAPDDAGAAVLGIVGVGGSDAPAVLDAVAERLTARGTDVLRATGRRLEAGDPLGAIAELIDLPADPAEAGTERKARDLLLDRMADGPAALLAGDAQWLDPASLRVLVGVAERAVDRSLSVVVTHRPAPGDPALAALDAALARRRPVVVLGPLDEAGVAERAALALDAGVDQQLVEVLAERTAGLPSLVELLVRSWAAAGVVTAGRLSAPPGELTQDLVAALRSEIDQLPSTARVVLSALSAGADLDDQLLGSVTGLAPGALSEAAVQLGAAGLLVPVGDDVVPLVADVVTALTPDADRRRFHAGLADALLERGAPPMQAAEHLAAAGARGPAAADAYVAAGEALLAESPELARAWFARAVDAGAPAGAVAGAEAEAAALDGDPANALRLADLALADAATPDRDRAQAVVAALLAPRGLWRRAGRLYDELATGEGPRAQGAGLLATVAAVATGAPDPGEDAGVTPGALVTTARARVQVPAPLWLDALSETAAGVAATRGSGGVDALAPFLEAAELLGASHGRLVLPDTPHALGAVTALALCDPTSAEHLLRGAIDQGAGGPAFADRHRLLLGWTGTRNGRWAQAQGSLDEVGDHDLTPRDALLAAAVEAALARRAGDLVRLTGAWGRAEPVLLALPVDLFSLEIVGELAITANRLGVWERIAPKTRELGDVVRALGAPPLWLLPLRWIGLQTALAGDDHEAAARRASEVEAVPPVHPRLSGLAEAARSWAAVLGGVVDVAQVQAAASGLARLGLAWEGSRLVGQAAIRSSDPSVTRSLLEQARDLRAGLPTTESAEVPPAAGVLSDREQIVAQHVVDGLTHKEIGAQLYISPKTVEHHVAKIRQKLGASTRAEMLAALRTQLDR